MNAYPDWLSLRDLDTRAGLPKGAAFRVFKQLGPQLREGLDFVLLDHQHAQQTIAALKIQGRAYQSTVNLVLLHPDAARHILSVLATHGSAPGN
ncbi:MAG: hypothetical protein M3O62_04480 [Pseudomonadota bacterium]|nr:hypothetical protein [Pseudomonadota bacterium]